MQFFIQTASKSLFQGQKGNLVSNRIKKSLRNVCGANINIYSQGGKGNLVSSRI